MSNKSPILSKNSVYLRRAKKALPPAGQVGVLPATVVAAFLKNISQLGYTLAPDLIGAVTSLSLDDVAAFYKETVASLKIMRGSHVKFSPMYPNFPAQVMEEDAAELFINAVIHYATGQLPSYTKEDRPAFLPEKGQLTVIAKGSEGEFTKIFRDILAAKSSISNADQDDLAWYVSAHSSDAAKIAEIVPAVIPQKENLAYFTALLLGIGHSDLAYPILGGQFKTATDVLRLSVALSGGDVSLAENTKFKSFSRKERRLLMALFEQCASLTEDMLRRPKVFIRLGERLHPNEFKAKFPKTQEAFSVLRDNKPFRTVAATTELAIEARDLTATLAAVSKRPGDFARRLDHLLRSFSEKTLILDHFIPVAASVSTPVLLQLMAHFGQRKVAAAAALAESLRVVFPKSLAAKAYALRATLAPIDETTCQAVVNLCEDVLQARFAKLAPLGKTFVSQALREQTVPFSQRSASKALRTISRGSRLAMPDAETVRFFLWWKEGKIGEVETGRVDLDLSAFIYDEKWALKEQVSYTNLRSAGYQAAHSGDITSAPEGACEFIDINVPSFLRYGGRYLVMCVYSYTGQAFADLPECFAGWMSRSAPKSGEIFEPSTVQDKLDISAATKICVPVIFDLKERKVIWCDMGLSSRPGRLRSVEGTEDQVSLLGRSMTSIAKPNLYDLFVLHAKARGQLVETQEEAASVFSMDQGVTPFDIEKILADYL